MRKGNLTREQAVAIVGEATVAKAEADNCDYSNRVQTDGDTAVEFCASARNEAGDIVIVYYYQSQEAIDGPGGDGVDDMGSLDWQIAGYEVI